MNKKIEGYKTYTEFDSRNGNKNTRLTLTPDKPVNRSLERVSIASTHRQTIIGKSNANS
jgi:hypothetical protein